MKNKTLRKCSAQVGENNSLTLISRTLYSKNKIATIKVLMGGGGPFVETVHFLMSSG